MGEVVRDNSDSIQGQESSTSLFAMALTEGIGAVLGAVLSVVTESPTETSTSKPYNPKRRTN